MTLPLFGGMPGVRPLGSKPANVQRAAVFDPEHRYRYVLRRLWGRGDTMVLFVGCNPSKADDQEDDPTVAQLARFAWEWGYDGFVLVNLFALISTDPKGLRDEPDPIGPENNATILREARAARVRVALWGHPPGPPKLKRDERERHPLTYRAEIVLSLLRSVGEVGCLARTKDGAPHHTRGLPRDVAPDKPNPYATGAGPESFVITSARAVCPSCGCTMNAGIDVALVAQHYEGHTPCASGAL